MPYAHVLLARCRTALVTDDQPQLLAVNIREPMVDDIRQRGLDVSVKTLKCCLATATGSDAYLSAMVVGTWCKNLKGVPVAPVRAEEPAYAVKHMVQEHAIRLLRAASEATPPMHDTN